MFNFQQLFTKFRNETFKTSSQLTPYFEVTSLESLGKEPLDFIALSKKEVAYAHNGAVHFKGQTVKSACLTALKWYKGSVVLAEKGKGISLLSNEQIEREFSEPVESIEVSEETGLLCALVNERNLRIYDLEDTEFRVLEEI